MIRHEKVFRIQCDYFEKILLFVFSFTHLFDVLEFKKKLVSNLSS